MSGKKFSTIIIGAGPAGLACAAVLATAARDILVLERKPRPGPKVCAGGITWAGMNDCLPGELVQRAFTEQHLFTSRRSITVYSENPIVATVDRGQLGRYMLCRAQRAGAHVHCGERLLQIEDGTVITDRGRYSYDFLVGADGSSSKVRRHLGLATVDCGFGLHYFVPGRHRQMEWHLDASLFGSGYAWIFPLRSTASIGVYSGERDIPAGRLHENFHRWAAGRKISLKDLQPKAALINFDYRGWKFGRTFLAGDAAGLASPLTGEGIYPAVISGEEIAASILNPRHRPFRLTRMLRRHRTHLRLQKLAAIHRLVSHFFSEVLLWSLERELLHFSALEMGDF